MILFPHSPVQCFYVLLQAWQLMDTSTIRFVGKYHLYWTKWNNGRDNISFWAHKSFVNQWWKHSCIPHVFFNHTAFLKRSRKPSLCPKSCLLTPVRKRPVDPFSIQCDPASISRCSAPWASWLLIYQAWEQLLHGPRITTIRPKGWKIPMLNSMDLCSEAPEEKWQLTSVALCILFRSNTCLYTSWITQNRNVWPKEKKLTAKYPPVSSHSKWETL